MEWCTKSLLLSCPAEDVISWSVYGGLNEGAALLECAAPPISCCLPASLPGSSQLTTSGVPSSDFEGARAAARGEGLKKCWVLGQIMGEDN